jgi:hypothetical protein
MPGFDMVINGERLLRYRAIPDLMIAFSWPLKIATVSEKYLLQARREAIH